VDLQGKSLSLSLTRDSIGEIIALLPPETKDYLDILMAPVFTGEILTPGEYKEVIGAAYGKTLASELDAAALSITLHTPGPAKTVRAPSPIQSSLKTGAATIVIPLTTILVLEQDISITVTW
jgi:hypothetical protein